MAVIRELSAHVPAPLPATRPPARGDPPPAQDEHSPFARLVRGFAGEADRGEATLHRVLGAGKSGVPLDATSLLALQAGVYRYGETMDLAARLVDKASSAVKTVVQGQ